VADDDGDLRAVYHFMLSDEGFDLIEASDGAQAVERFRHHRPDLVLMDILMPVKTGEEAIREILAIDPEARIIAVTAYDYDSLRLGVRVLRKGFHKAELLGLLEECWRDTAPGGEPG
jgi:CheY-like chemotaxis protein